MRTLGGRYELIEQIGAGGMAAVWRARDETLDREVAVKLLTQDGDGGTEAERMQSFQRAHNEARSAARLAHPNVAAVYDFGTSRRSSQGAAYVVMELLEGQLLSTYLQQARLSWMFAARICAEISAGLSAAHIQGIVHRDVKPANVMVTQSGAKVLDFGIAARVGEEDQSPDGTLLGTSAYMAPERFAGEPVRPPLDMYGVGIVLYRCLTTGLPWDARTHEELEAAHRTRPPAPLPHIDGLAPEVAEICLACLEKDPAKRPTSVAAALILAASVGAQVYLPPILKPPARTADTSEWDQVTAPTPRAA